MATTAGTTLGAQLTKFMRQLADQVDVTKSAGDREKLRKLHRKAARQLQELIDKTVPPALAEYETATEALDAANEALKKSQKDIGKVADAITMAGRALSALAKLVALL